MNTEIESHRATVVEELLKSSVHHEDPHIAAERRLFIEEWIKTYLESVKYLNDDELQFLCESVEDKGCWSNAQLDYTRLVILACQHNKIKILKYLLEENNIPQSTEETSALLPGNNETNHKVFYYAVRSGNVELLDLLINKFPENYFTGHLKKLDEILSKAYNEIKLKNVPLSEEMVIFVENKLVNLRFFSEGIRKDQKLQRDINKIQERINLVLQNIGVLKVEYSNAEKIDEKFLFIAKFIAQNIHVLKRQLKSTYDRLPWEEIEFCLITFISSHLKKQEINLFYNATLNKSNILSHLENFAKKLEEEKKFLKDNKSHNLTDLPKLKRDKVVSEISNCPEFERLYIDYQQIRDIHSLQKISDYIKLSVSADPKQTEGRLIVIRALQVIGEYLKNTLESPKLSTITSELLLESLPRNTRQIIINLRNSFSHAYSLSKRTEIEENTDINFFIGVQSDIIKIDNVITDILYNYKIKMIKILLEKIVKSKNLDEVKEIGSILNNVEFDKMFKENFHQMEHDKLEKIIKKFSMLISDKTKFELELFNVLANLINCAKTKSKNIQIDYFSLLMSLKSLSISLNEKIIDHNTIRGIKFCVTQILKNIPSQMEPNSLKEIAQISMLISHSVKSRIKEDNLDLLDKISRLSWEILFLLEFETNDLKWISKLRESLNEKNWSTPMHKIKKTCDISKKKLVDQFELKLSDLKSILNNNKLTHESNENFIFYRKNVKLQAVIEMLVLDMASILDLSQNQLENNLLFLDDYAPIITGKNLRNHLAHDNTLIDIILADPSIAVFLNAKKIISENLIKSKKKIGKFIKDDPAKLKDRYNQSLMIVTNQEKMFAALEKGNTEELKICLSKGADIAARSNNLSTALHFASCGSDLEIIKFLVDQKLSVNVKDENGQSPLHSAAAYGRKNIVEFFLRESGMQVNDSDNNGKTPLHVAAENGHKDVVKILLENNAKISAKDQTWSSPLHCAIKNNHIEVIKILLKKESNVDINEALGGFTPLHIAAERGYLELIEFLLKKNANVNARNDNQGVPLHAAALNGHLEVVNYLILNGADVNARMIDGCTALHYAVENGHEEIAAALLNNGAEVNAADITYKNTPLHYAALDGYEQIVKILLSNKANPSVVTAEGLTPLHMAVHKGHLEIVRTFLEYGADIRVTDKRNFSLMHFAAEGGHKAVAELLLNLGLDVNHRANCKLTPLHVAASKNHKEIIELLIKNNADIGARNIVGDTPLHEAAMNGMTGVIGLLVKRNADVDEINNINMTPLQLAALYGHEDAVDMLIKSKANINKSASNGMTALHFAIMKGYDRIVELLVKNKAEVNYAYDKSGLPPLWIAVEAGFKKIVKILVENGADVNIATEKRTPVISAIIHNNLDIVKILIENGAALSVKDGELMQPLAVAVLAGNKDIVEVLLKNNARINTVDYENNTLLHLAAKRGHTEIVNSLVQKGVDVNATNKNGITALYYAAQEGHEEVVETLSANKANINVLNLVGSPLHIAAGTGGHVEVVRVLLKNGAKINLKDSKNRIPLELAVAHGHLQIVKMILQCKKVNINFKCNDNWTLLHIASGESNLEIVKFLVNEGADINAKNSSGTKPIHIAARDGFINTVKVFLDKGMSINELGMANQTVLHYAAMGGQLEVVKYLIKQGADIDRKDRNDQTSMHFAAVYNHKDVIEVLLKNGAVYNPVNKYCNKPVDMTTNKDIIKLLTLTEKLFESVKHNNPLEVERDIKAGACINAKKHDKGTPLHYAAWKGYNQIVNLLLQNKANPNAFGSKKCTPLHYAAKFSHLKIVKVLLFHCAIYNPLSESNKTPFDLAVDENVKSLLKLVDESFKKIKNNNPQIIYHLNNVKDVDTIKAVMRACDREQKTLIVSAIHNNFSKIEELKQVFQSNASSLIDMALVLLNQGSYQEALKIFQNLYEKRKDILGPDNPGTLDIQSHIASVLYKQGLYHETLTLFQEILQNQKENLGVDNKETLKTRSSIALVLHRQGKNQDALEIFEEVYKKQKKLLGSDDLDTLNSEFHMALVLNSLGKFDEALSINKEIYEKRKKTHGPLNSATISAQNNIAMVLLNQSKFEESMKIYQEVLKIKKKIFGINHVDTLRTLFSMAGILFKQGKHHESLEAYQEVLSIQKKVLRQNHPEILNTQYYMGNVLFAQGKIVSALKIFKESFELRKFIFGPNDPTVLDILKKVEAINLVFKLKGIEPSELLSYLQNEINNAASKGDIQTVSQLLKGGSDVNEKDVEGRTPLHYAVGNLHVGVVNLLLKNGANVNQVTNKGNTPLHTAVSKSCKEIVEILLKSISREKLSGFINAKTIAAGTTALHVAAKDGSFEIVKTLLKHGAVYDVKNTFGKTPVDLSQDQKVISTLKLIEEMFEDIKNGKIESVYKLRAVKLDEFSAMINARNNEGNTLLLVALNNKHKNITNELLKIQKEMGEV